MSTKTAIFAAKIADGEITMTVQVEQVLRTEWVPSGDGQPPIAWLKDITFRVNDVPQSRWIGKTVKLETPTGETGSPASSPSPAHSDSPPLKICHSDRFALENRKRSDSGERNTSRPTGRTSDHLPGAGIAARTRLMAAQYHRSATM